MTLFKRNQKNCQMAVHARHRVYVHNLKLIISNDRNVYIKKGGTCSL